MKSLKKIYTTCKEERKWEKFEILMEGGWVRMGVVQKILNMAHFGECLPCLAPETGFVSAHCLCQ